MSRQNLMLLLLLLPLLQSAVAATDDVCSMRPGYPMCTNAQHSVNPLHPQESISGASCEFTNSTCGYVEGCSQDGCATWTVDETGYVEWWADKANQSDQSSQQFSRTLESPLLTLTFPSCLTFTSSMDGDVQLGVFLSRPAASSSCTLNVVNGTSNHPVESSTSSSPSSSSSSPSFSSSSSSSPSSSSSSSSSFSPSSSSSSSPSAVWADNSTDGSLETHRIDLPAVGETKIAFRAVLQGHALGFVRLHSVHVAAGCCHDTDWSEIAGNPADHGPPSPCDWTVEGWTVSEYLGVTSDQAPAALTSPWLLPTKPDTLDCVYFHFYLTPNKFGDASLTAILVDATNRKFPLWKLTNERFDSNSNGTTPTDGMETETKTTGANGFVFEFSQAKFPVNFTTGMFKLRWTVEMDHSEDSLVVMSKLTYTRNQSTCELEPHRALFTAETSPTFPPTLTRPASRHDDGGVAVPVIAGSAAAAGVVVVVAVVVVTLCVVRYQRKRKAAKARGKKLIIPLTDILQAGRLSTNSYTDTPRTSSAVSEGTGPQQSPAAATDDGHRSDHAGRNGGLPSPYETVEGEGNPAAQEKTTSSTDRQLSLNRAMADGNASTTIAASQGVGSDPDPTYDRLGVLKTPAREAGPSSLSSPPSSMSTSRRGAYDHLSFEGDEESAYDVTHRDRRFRIIDSDYSDVQISKDQKTSVN